MAKDPELNPALNVKVNVYSVALSTFAENKAPMPVHYEIAHFQGASTSPVFSPDGKSAAFLSMYKGGYESEKNQIFLIRDVGETSVTRLLAGDDNEGSWDKSPQVCPIDRYL